jgi:uncharacterized protein YoxC
MTSEDLKQIKTLFDVPFNDLKKDVGGLKKDVGSLKKDVGGLKKEVGKLGEKINCLDKKVDDLDGKTNRLVAVTVSIREDLNTKFATKDDLFDTKNDILNHIDGLAQKIGNHDENMEYNKQAHKGFDQRINVLEEMHNIIPVKF